MARTSGTRGEHPYRMLKKAVLFVRRPSFVPRRSQAENFISCEIRFTRDASRDTVFALADFFSILLGWEERAPTEDSIGTAEILAGL